MVLNGGIVYFLGIGGIGMSALARFFKAQGREVYGYDLTPTPLTKELENEGMIIHYNDDINLIPADIDFVVYTPAIPFENSELRYFYDNGYELKKRSKVLGEISGNHFTIAVAGTHGKTSISILASHLLKIAGKNITALVGGISKNYNTNFISSDQTDILLLEADEYDRSFLQLNPDISVVSSVDSDHLDIYGTHQMLEDAFMQFAHKLKKNGILIHHTSLFMFNDLNKRNITYSAKGAGECVAENIRVEEGKYVFDMIYKDFVIKDIVMAVPGLHYVENALAASLIAFEAGVSSQKVKEGLESFKGVLRRFDFRLKRDDIVFIDDYAHHPSEIKVTVNAVKRLFPDKKVTGVFQPHLYSRTKDFSKGFAESLELLDEIILLDIYPAREKPIEGVSSKLIFDNIKNDNKRLINKNELTKYLENNKPEVLITLGAGDIGLMLNEIEEVFKK